MGRIRYHVIPTGRAFTSCAWFAVIVIPCYATIYPHLEHFYLRFHSTNNQEGYRKVKVLIIATGRLTNCTRRQR